MSRRHVPSTPSAKPRTKTSHTTTDCIENFYCGRSATTSTFKHPPRQFNEQNRGTDKLIRSKTEPPKPEIQKLEIFGNSGNHNKSAKSHKSRSKITCCRFSQSCRCVLCTLGTRPCGWRRLCTAHGGGSPRAERSSLPCCKGDRGYENADAPWPPPLAAEACPDAGFLLAQT